MAGVVKFKWGSLVNKGLPLTVLLPVIAQLLDPIPSEPPGRNFKNSFCLAFSFMACACPTSVAEDLVVATGFSLNKPSSRYILAKSTEVIGASPG